jgi:hypothetical protein
MSSKSTALFGASLLAAIGAIAVDYTTSEAPKAAASHEESFNPCAAAMPAPKAGERNYDDIADDYSGGAAAPAPAPSPSPADSNPCAAGVL